jgi:hypothetical protein
MINLINSKEDSVQFLITPDLLIILPLGNNVNRGIIVVNKNLLTKIFSLIIISYKETERSICLKVVNEDLVDIQFSKKIEDVSSIINIFKLVLVLLEINDSDFFTINCNVHDTLSKQNAIEEVTHHIENLINKKTRLPNIKG